MTEVAAECADGVICHAFTTMDYMRKITFPAIVAGLKKAGRNRADFQISYPCFMVTGDEEEGFNKNLTLIKRQIAFYGSTPAYRGVLESIGVGDLQQRLNTMSKEGKWREMGELITDDILQEFALVGEPDKIGRAFLDKYGDLVDRVSVPYTNLSADNQSKLIASMK